MARRLECWCKKFYDASEALSHGRVGHCSLECFEKVRANRQIRKDKRTEYYANHSGRERLSKKQKKRLGKRDARLGKMLAEKHRRNEYRAKSEEFLQSSQWKCLRFEVLRKFGYRCMACGAKPPGVVIHVDHIKPRFHYPDLALDMNNLQVLCSMCNQGKGARFEDDLRPQIVL